MLIRKSSSPLTQFSPTRTILLIIIVALLVILGIKLLFFRTQVPHQPTSQSIAKNSITPPPTDAFTAQVEEMFNHNTNLVSGTVTTINAATNTLHLTAKNSAGKEVDYTILTDPNTVIFQKPSTASPATYQKVSFEQIKSPYQVFVYGIAIPANNQIAAKGLSVDLPPAQSATPRKRFRVGGTQK